MIAGNVALTPKSKNEKTGAMPVSTSTKEWCPDSCPLKEAGCYAKYGHTGIHWRLITAATRGTDWNEFCARVEALPENTGIWRHDVAGDLPAENGIVDAGMMRSLIQANRGKGGFTYTHHNADENAEIILEANHNGFTVNLSADNAGKADVLADMAIAPVVTLLPTGSKKVTYTPAGRKVVRCPAETSERVTCKTCRLCQKTDRPIIGFTPHGSGKKVTQEVASQ
jgi:hypothetical protein